MRLVVGLGNPGPEYTWTRHNLGFMVVAALAEGCRISLKQRKLEASWGQGRVDGEPIILAQPQTYMNLSGRAVSRLLHYWRLAPTDLIIIHDDLDVPFGRLKLAKGGGPGGHRGVLSIINALATEEFYRIKMGIGRAPAGVPPEEFVLSPFSREELEEVASLVERAAQAVAALLTEGLVAAQNRFHRAPVSDT